MVLNAERGEIKEHECYPAWPGPVKQEDDDVIHSHLWLVGKLKGSSDGLTRSRRCTRSLKVLHQVGSQRHWSVVAGGARAFPLWYRNKAGCVAQHRDPLQTRLVGVCVVLMC